MAKLGSPDSNRITRAPFACARSRTSRIWTILPKEISSMRCAARLSVTAAIINPWVEFVRSRPAEGSGQHHRAEMRERVDRALGLVVTDHEHRTFQAEVGEARALSRRRPHVRRPGVC